jgi:hypothetical protein
MTEAKIEVFEAWFAEVFDELFSMRSAWRTHSAIAVDCPGPRFARDSSRARIGPTRV